MTDRVIVSFLWLLLRGRKLAPLFGLAGIAASFLSATAISISFWAAAAVIYAFHLGLFCGETGLRAPR